MAREIVIRMANRRVLNSWECCDNCIDQALESLQKIRQLLVDQQVKFSKATDGPLYELSSCLSQFGSSSHLNRDCENQNILGPGDPTPQISGDHVSSVTHISPR